MGKSDLKIHNFYERLNFSEQSGHEEFWQDIYKKAFPDMLFATLCTGKCQGQYLGIDRIIQLRSGKTLFIDEKKREKEYEDILLEYISVDKLQTPGWMESELLIDFLAYAFIQSKRCYLFPWPLLRRVWIHYKESWMREWPHIEAQNVGYKTLSVAIPIVKLLNVIKSAMIIKV